MPSQLFKLVDLDRECLHDYHPDQPFLICMIMIYPPESQEYALWNELGI